VTGFQFFIVYIIRSRDSLSLVADERCFVVREANEMKMPTPAQMKILRANGHRVKPKRHLSKLKR